MKNEEKNAEGLVPYRVHGKALMVLGIPIVIGQLGTIAQSFADTIMVGQYGTPELSASGFVNNVFNLVIFFLLGFSYSTTPIVGSYFGRKQLADAGRTLKESLAANLLVCLVVCGLMLLLYANIDILNQPKELMPLIKPYYLILLSSMPFMAVFNSVKQFSDGVGDTKTPMWIMLTGNVVNILLNVVLIFGFSFSFLGLKIHSPAFGLNGAGLATLISRVAMLVVLAWLVLRAKRYEKFRVGLKKPMTRLGFFHVTKVGLPISVQMCLESSSFNIAAVMMGWLGAVSLAAHQVMGTIGTLCFLVYYGVGAAAAVRISHFRGRGEWREVRRIAFAAYGLNLIAAVVLAGGIFIGREALCYCFTTSSEVVTVTLSLMIPFLFYQLGDSMQVVFANSLRAIEDVKPLVWYAFIAYILVSIPVSYLFAFVLKMGPQGVWWGFPFGLTTAGLLFFQRFYRKTKTEK